MFKLYVLINIEIVKYVLKKFGIVVFIKVPTFSCNSGVFVIKGANYNLLTIQNTFIVALN